MNFLRESEQLLHITEANEQEANAQTQDILHSLELEDVGYHGMANAAKLLKVVRQTRRAAKDLNAKVTPIVEWIEENRAVVKSLERLLGAVRKAEKNCDARLYTAKTDVLQRQSK